MSACREATAATPAAETAENQLASGHIERVLTSLLREQEVTQCAHLFKS